MFQLGEAALGGDVPRALRILAGLRSEGVEPTLALWSLSREIHNVWGTTQNDGPARAAGRSHRPRWTTPSAAPASCRMRASRRALARADRMIKGQHRGDAWDEMSLIIVEFAGRRALPLDRDARRLNTTCTGRGPIGLFGGTFDPIHYGHLRTAFELWQSLKLAEVRFLPTGNPPHRERTLADAALRVAMVRAAVADQPAFVVDDREVRRAGASYTVDTLTELRAEFPHRSLCLLLGMDAFLGLPNWHRWRELFDLAHVVVAHRPGWKAPTQGPLGELMVDRGTGAVSELHRSPAGRIYVHAVTQLEISSTELRQIIDAGRDPRFLVPDAVRDDHSRIRVLCSAPLIPPTE